MKTQLNPRKKLEDLIAEGKGGMRPASSKKKDK